MRYYRNIEIAKRFGIGSSTVKLWIDNSVAGKNNLEIKEIKQLTNDKIVYKLLSNPHNERELTKLFQEGRSRNQLSLKKTIKIDTSTLNIFTTKQVSELISSLEDKHIPMKLTYMNGGAELWNEYVVNGRKSGGYSATKRTEELLDTFITFLNQYNPENKKINFFDIGCGNFLPTRTFINYLNKKNLLSKYIAVDISHELLDIAEKEALQILNPNQIIKIQRDFEVENLRDYANPYREADTMNVIALLGSTLGSYIDQRTILTHLRDTLVKDDLLIISNKLNSEIDKTKFSHILEKNEQLLWIPALLGIDTGEVQFNSYFDEKREARVIAMKLDKDYSFTFTYPDSTAENKIYLYAHDHIILWHHKMTKIEDVAGQFQRAGLEYLAYFKTQDDNNAMFVTRKKSYSDRL